MRSKIIAIALLVSAIAKPSATVAEPTYEIAVNRNSAEIVENIKKEIEPYKTKTKDEIAQEQIKAYAEKLAKERQKAQAKKRISSKQKRNIAPVASNITLPENNACVIAMKKVFPKHLWKIGYAIMMAESGARPNAIGGPNYNGTYDYGCWQINNTKRALNPDVGAQIAWYKYNHSGWYPWTVYRTGRYLRFM